MACDVGRVFVLCRECRYSLIYEATGKVRHIMTAVNLEKGMDV